MINKKQKTQSKELVNRNPFETVSDIPKSVARSLGSDVVKGMSSDFISQLIGLDSQESPSHRKISGNLAEGQEINLQNAHKQEKTPVVHAEPGFDYKGEILHGERRMRQEEQYAIRSQIQEILIELKRLTSSSQTLAMEFKEVSSQQTVVNPGKYHVSFFEWVLNLIRTARMKVEDSAAWLSMFKSKKAKQKYWNMFKKHGTTFGLSNERVVATQTG